MEDTVTRAEFEALRAEVRHGSSYINTRLDSIDLQLLRQNHQMEGLRTDMKEMRTELRTEIKEVREELRAEIKQVREDLTESFNKTIHDAVDGVMAGMERMGEALRAEIRNSQNR